jgi:5-methylcytosine-specific restriction endonuclease McrA
MKEWHAAKDAKRRQASGRLSKGIVEELLIRQRGLCACCKRDLGSDYHIDHIMPIALGGTNTDDNVQLLLAECNMRKGAKHPDEWRKTLAPRPVSGWPMVRLRAGESRFFQKNAPRG